MYNHEILVVKLGSDRLRGILGMDFLSQKSAVLFSKSRKLKIGKNSAALTQIKVVYIRVQELE